MPREDYTQVRIDQETIARVDRLKGSDLIPRDPFIRQLLNKQLDAEEAAKRAKRRKKPR